MTQIIRISSGTHNQTELFISNIKAALDGRMMGIKGEIIYAVCFIELEQGHQLRIEMQDSELGQELTNDVKVDIAKGLF